MLRTIARKILRGIVLIAFSVFLVFLTLVMAVNMPYVQTKIVHYLTRKISDTLKYPVQIGTVNISWFDRMVLRNVMVRDAKNKDMILVKRLVVNFDLPALFRQRIVLEEAVLTQARVTMVSDAKTGKVNLTEFIDAISALSGPSTNAPSANPGVFTISSVLLDNSRFIYDDQAEDSIRNGFDYYHSTYDSISAKVSNFRVRADTIEMGIADLKSVETGSRLHIHKLNTFLRTTSHIISLTKLKADIGKSHIARSLVFSFKSYDDFSNFNAKVKMTAELDSSAVNLADLSLFAPKLKGFTDVARISGKVKGTVNKLKVSNFKLAFGAKSHIDGTLSTDGLPDWDNTMITLRVKQADAYARDLEQYSNGAVRDAFNKLGLISIKGSFTGFPNDFVADAQFHTLLGNFKTDLQLVLDTGNLAESKYNGHLVTDDFELGKFFDTPELQALDMEGSVKGSGFSPDLAKLTVDAKVMRIGALGYNYHNIAINGNYNRRFVQGKILIADSNLNLNLNGTVKVKKGENIFNLSAELAKANLKNLGFSKTPFSLSGNLYTDFSGTELTLDAINGTAMLRQTKMAYQGRHLNLPVLALNAERKGGQRKITLTSSAADIKLSGNFNFSSLKRDVPQLVSSFADLFTEPAENALQKHITQHVKKWRIPRPAARERYELELEATLNNISPFVQLFVPNLYISKKALLSASFSEGLSGRASITFSSDTLNYAGSKFYKNTADFSADKVNDSSSVLASLYLRSDRQQLGSLDPTDHLRADLEWDSDTLGFTGDIAQTGTPNKVSLAGGLRFMRDSLLINLHPCDINLINRDWHFLPGNSISISHGKARFRKLTLTDTAQSIQISGMAGDQPDDSVNIKIADFSLQTLNSLTGGNLGGKLDGNIFIKSALGKPGIHGNIALINLKTDDFLVGNIIGSSYWDSDKSLLRVNVDLLRTDVNSFRIQGSYDPNNEAKPIDLTAHIRSASLSLMEPILKGMVTDWSGKADGDLALSGSFKKPVITGDLNISNGKMRYIYLNTTWGFTDKLTFGENFISARNLTLYDVNKNTATIPKAVLRHNYFSDFGVSLAGSLNKFQVLNTDSKQNNPYYGRVNVTGDFAMEGSFSDLAISANVRTEKGTKLYIPLDNKEDLSAKKDFITFYDRTKTRSQNLKDSVDKPVDISGITLDFNIEVTPAADAEIILNSQTNDIITGKGRGNLKVGLDTRGDFTLLGQYTFESGIYNFTFGNLANKKFNINNGSTIVWSGNPLNGILSINATYEMLVSLKPLVDQTDEATLASPAFSRKYPIQVSLGITGELMHPVIQYGVKLKEGYPSIVQPQVAAFESRVALNDQERSLQLFSLFVFGTLYNSDQGLGGNSNLALSGSTSGLTEMLSNQISSMLSTGNLQFNLNLNGIDKDAFAGVNVGIGYQTGRFRISRNGGFTNLSNQATAQSIVGDWTIEYMLTRSGILRLKMSYRNNVNVTGLNNVNNSSTTFSVMHTQSFNRLKELWKHNNTLPENQPARENKSPADSSGSGPVKQPAHTETKEQKSTGKPGATNPEGSTPPGEK